MPIWLSCLGPVVALAPKTQMTWIANMLTMTAPEFTPCFIGVRVTRSLVLCVYFVHRCLYLFLCPLCCLSFFDLRILITSLWYLQTHLTTETRRVYYVRAYYVNIYGSL